MSRVREVPLCEREVMPVSRVREKPMIEREVRPLSRVREVPLSEREVRPLSRETLIFKLSWKYLCDLCRIFVCSETFT